MTYTLLPATEADAHELAPLLRAPDRAEVLALGLDPIDGLLQSVRESREAWTARADGQIICMTGVCPLTSIGQTGVPWLLGSDLVPAHGPHFLRESRRLVARWLGMFSILQNRVPADYEAALCWARWLGFTVHPERPFCRITMEAPTSHGRLRARRFQARDLLRVKANPVFERPPELLRRDMLEALARLPTYTLEMEGRVVACGGVVPHDGGHEAWAYITPDRPLVISVFNFCRRFLDDYPAAPVRALVDEPSERWARLLGFRPTDRMRDVAGGRSLPIYERG